MNYLKDKRQNVTQIFSTVCYRPVVLRGIHKSWHVKSLGLKSKPTILAVATHFTRYTTAAHTRLTVASLFSVSQHACSYALAALMLASSLCEWKSMKVAPLLALQLRLDTFSKVLEVSLRYKVVCLEGKKNEHKMCTRGCDSLDKDILI